MTTTMHPTEKIFVMVNTMALVVFVSFVPAILWLMGTGNVLITFYVIIAMCGTIAYRTSYEVNKYPEDYEREDLDISLVEFVAILENCYKYGDNHDDCKLRCFRGEFEAMKKGPLKLFVHIIGKNFKYMYGFVVFYGLFYPLYIVSVLVLSTLALSILFFALVAGAINALIKVLFSKKTTSGLRLMLFLRKLNRVGEKEELLLYKRRMYYVGPRKI